MRKVLLTMLLLLTSASAIAAPADERLREYFDIPDSTELTESNIANSVLKRIPIGTSETEIYTRLDNAGIGKDGLSSYYHADKNKLLSVKLSLTQTRLALLKRVMACSLFWIPSGS